MCVCVCVCVCVLIKHLTLQVALINDIFTIFNKKKLLNYITMFFILIICQANSADFPDFRFSSVQVSIASGRSSKVNPVSAQQM